MTKFKPGVSGNPNGRPKKRDSIRDMLREELAGEIDVNGEKLTKAQFIAKKAFALAAQGDMAAIKYLSDQVDGAPKQTIEHSGHIEHAPVSPEAALAAAQALEESGEV